jgi:hypothetical protein
MTSQPCPPAIIQLSAYLNSLQFGDAPDYKLLRGLVAELDAPLPPQSVEATAQTAQQTEGAAPVGPPATTATPHAGENGKAPRGREPERTSRGRDKERSRSPRARRSGSKSRSRSRSRGRRRGHRSKTRSRSRSRSVSWRRHRSRSNSRRRRRQSPSWDRKRSRKGRKGRRSRSRSPSDRSDRSRSRSPGPIIEKRSTVGKGQSSSMAALVGLMRGGGITVEASHACSTLLALAPADALGVLCWYGEELALKIPKAQRTTAKQLLEEVADFVGGCARRL